MKPQLFPFLGVVVVADVFRAETFEVPADRRPDLEKSEPETLKALVDVLKSLGLKVYHYHSPSELGLNARKHQNDIVMTLYGGERSRNRMALVPAICEAHNLRYLGPDTYARIVCQDKEISKNLAKSCGLETPRWRVVRNREEVEYMASFPLPFVIKPLLEGSSIGISSRNLVHKHSDGFDLAFELLQAFEQPVMIEEFTPGREVSFNCIETIPTRLWAYSEILVEGRPDYFDKHLFDAEEKRYRLLSRNVRTIDEELSSADRLNLNKLLTLISPFSYCRVDGKHFDGKFVFLELTPDAWIAPPGAFACSFTNRGMSYAEVISAILSSTTPNPPNRSANG